LKAIVAFANTSGGVVVLGVEDGTKKVTGIRDVLTEEERLANLISDSISPKLVPSMEVMPWRKTQILAVEIYPSPNRPHYLNRLGPAEGVFVRVGPTKPARRPNPQAVSIVLCKRFSVGLKFSGYTGCT
jgi:predicted HTH transcriptional regulator